MVFISSCLDAANSFVVCQNFGVKHIYCCNGVLQHLTADIWQPKAPCWSRSAHRMMRGGESDALIAIKV